MPVVSSSTLENVYNNDLSGSKRSDCNSQWYLGFLEETNLLGRTLTKAIKSLSWAGTGCSQVVAISCLRHLGYCAAGCKARVTCPSCKSHRPLNVWWLKLL